MEEVVIRRFLASNGYGDGDGNGDGNGYGNGDGNGDGNGNGDGDGNGNGNGYGYGNGDGNGYGDGDGDGNGYGNGDGNGDGNGYGDGDGDGNGIKLETHQGSPVHYIDTLPCVIRSIKREVAMVDVIDVNSFDTSKMFVAKHGGLFAHGKTIEEAMEAAQNKWAETRSIEDRMDEFKKLFKKGVEYDAHLFYKWHTTLTGSCQSGKDFWIEQQGIDLKKPMTVQTFFSLTQNAYGGETIRRLMEHYK